MCSYENLNKQFFKWAEYHMKNHASANWSPFVRVGIVVFL